MNSKKLQEQFPEVYENFFSKNTFILSWSLSLPFLPSWTGKRLKHIRIKAKVPLKLYVWFKKIKWTKAISINEVISYDIVNNNFESKSFEIVNKQKNKLEDFLNDFLIKNWLESCYEVNILSEVTRWHWFWFSWAMSSVLALAIFLLLDDLKLEDLNDYDDFINSEIFNEIYLFALKIVTISKHKNTTGSNVLSTLKNYLSPSLINFKSFVWKYAIIFQTNKKEIDFTHRSFYEYFLALYFVDNYDDEKEFEKIIINGNRLEVENFFNNKVNIIKFYIDIMDNYIEILYNKWYYEKVYNLVWNWIFSNSILKLAKNLKNIKTKTEQDKEFISNIFQKNNLLKKEKIST
jgi:hypothetical protein